MIIKTLKQVQDAAKKQGFCHCDLGQKCPCKKFLDTKKCECFIAFNKLKKENKK
jgi:hypothetical protein